MMLRILLKTLHGPIYASRLRVLVREIVAELREGDRVLDVGCGFGGLGRAILDAPECPAGVTVAGLERERRGGELIDVIGYEGGRIPFDDDSFDIVILADVLHHEEHPDDLVRECARVARRRLIIKDHQLRGLFAQGRIAFMDWAANVPYGVRCLYRYRTGEQWRESHERHRLRIDRELMAMRLYPPFVNWMFGGRLQYMAFLEPATDAAEAPDEAGDQGI